MAKKRTLKRAIRGICEELFTEAIAVSLYGPETVKTNAQALAYTIVRLERDFTSRVSHIEPGMKPRDYFKDLKEKFSAQVDDILHQLNG